jgi:hypothetical protein
MGIGITLHKEEGFDFPLKKFHYKINTKWAILNTMKPYESLKKNVSPFMKP